MSRLAVLSCLVLCLCGCDVMQRISTGAYRNAVADGAVAELRERGINVTGRPDCHTSGAGSDEVLKVSCTTRTTGGEPVVVRGDVTEADTKDPHEEYVILVGGREVLRKPCLDLGCKEDR